MPDKYIVSLTEEERRELHQLTSRGTLPARKMKRAQILLCADKGQKDEAISQALSVGLSVVNQASVGCVVRSS